MRPSVTDKYVCFAMIIVFLYSFFIVGGKPIYFEEGEMVNGVIHRSDELRGVEYPSSVYVAPLVFFFFFMFMVFEKELELVSFRHVVKKTFFSLKHMLFKN